MNDSIKLILFLMLISIVTAGVILLNWDFPAPVSKIEKTLSDDRFPK